MDKTINFGYRGARACTILHEDAMHRFVETWKKAKAAGVALPETKDLNYASFETLLVHVLFQAGDYMVWICEKLELPDPEIKPVPGPESVETEVDDYLEHLLEQWSKPLREVRGRRFYSTAFTARWNVDYCIDAMLEHAVMHPIRHRFQLEELMDILFT